MSEDAQKDLEEFYKELDESVTLPFSDDLRKHPHAVVVLYYLPQGRKWPDFNKPDARTFEWFDHEDAMLDYFNEACEAFAKMVEAGIGQAYAVAAVSDTKADPMVLADIFVVSTPGATEATRWDVDTVWGIDASPEVCIEPDPVVRLPKPRKAKATDADATLQEDLEESLKQAKVLKARRRNEVAEIIAGGKGKTKRAPAGHLKTTGGQVIDRAELKRKIEERAAAKANGKDGKAAPKAATPEDAVDAFVGKRPARRVKKDVQPESPAPTAS